MPTGFNAFEVDGKALTGTRARSTISLYSILLILLDVKQASRDLQGGKYVGVFLVVSP